MSNIKKTITDKKIKQKKYAEVDRSTCVACGCCVKVCPKDAISVYRGLYASVDVDKCIGCGLCSRECPASVIEILKAGVEA